MRRIYLFYSFTSLIPWSICVALSAIGLAACSSTKNDSLDQSFAGIQAPAGQITGSSGSTPGGAGAGGKSSISTVGGSSGTVKAAAGGNAAGKGGAKATAGTSQGGGAGAAGVGAGAGGASGTSTWPQCYASDKMPADDAALEQRAPLSDYATTRKFGVSR
jgi:hypothetical protein